jgi:hypothetical protein
VRNLQHAKSDIDKRRENKTETLLSKEKIVALQCDGESAPVHTDSSM